MKTDRHTNGTVQVRVRARVRFRVKVRDAATVSLTAASFAARQRRNS